MAILGVRVPDDLAARFDAVAWAVGGRSALLRRLIAESVEGAPGPIGVGPHARDAAKVTVKLGPVETTHVDVQAATMGLTRAGWVAALVRRHALGRPCLPPTGEVAVLAVQAEVYRIRVGVNHILRLLSADLNDHGAGPHRAELAAMRVELGAHLLALRQAFRGNLHYWNTDP